MIPAALLVAVFLAFTVYVHPGEWGRQHGPVGAICGDLTKGQMRIESRMNENLLY